jgi:hypothetical protein
MTKVSKKLQHKLAVLNDNKVVSKLWKLYKQFYQKDYQTAEEEKERIDKFISNLKIIIRENFRFDQGVKSFKLHLNRFGDMDLSEFRKKMTGLKSDRAVYTEPFLMQRRKRFFVDSVKKRMKKIKDKINKKLHPGQDQTDDSVRPVTPITESTRRTTSARRITSTATSESMVDYRPYMNPIENQGQCG